MQKLKLMFMVQSLWVRGTEFKNAFNFLWCNEIKFYQQSKKCKVLKMCKEKGGWLSKVNKNEFSYDIFVSFEKVFLMTLKVSTNKFLLLIRFALCTWNLVLQFKKIQTTRSIWISVYKIWMVLQNVYSIFIYKDPRIKLLIHLASVYVYLGADLFPNNPCDEFKILSTKNEFLLGNITYCLDVVRLS